MKFLGLIFFLTLISCVSAPEGQKISSGAIIPDTTPPHPYADIIPEGDDVRYVRIDGGNSNQCNGKYNSAYSPSLGNTNCAWSHPRFAFGYTQASTGGSSDFTLGVAKTLYIESGNYKIGYGMPESAACSTPLTNTCVLGKIPSQITVLGRCSNPPKLIGVEKLPYVLNLTGQSGITLKCLEITDQSECVEGYLGAQSSSSKCRSDLYPYGNWARMGLYATDSSSVSLLKVHIHGLAHSGLHLGRISDWKIKDSAIEGNGWMGWNGTLENGSSSNSGTISIENTRFAWNGCIERLQGGHTGCWSNQAGGSGHGVSLPASGGLWIFDKVTVEYNSGDGLDLSQLSGSGVSQIKNSRVAHNSGHQVRVAQTATVENNLILGECSYHSAFPSMGASDLCRNSGYSVSVATSSSAYVRIRRNTIVGEGACLLQTNGTGGTVDVEDNIFEGRMQWPQNVEKACFHEHDGGAFSLGLGFNLVFQTKFGTCPVGQLCVDPLFMNPEFIHFDPFLMPGSPASGMGVDPSSLPD